jgi:hypothetical protein
MIGEARLLFSGVLLLVVQLSNPLSDARYAE